MRTELRRLWNDDRAIEGLPIRLVIALVVGVTSLSVMMSMLSGINGLAVSELDAKPTPEVVSPGAGTVDVTVIDSNGDPVSGATLIVRDGTADLDGVRTATTDGNGEASVRIDPSLGTNQDDGTLEIEIKPPAGSEFVDKQENTEILVVAD